MTTRKKLRIGVLFGGRSGEHEVSLMSARSILDALDPEKYEVTQIGISQEGTWLAGAQALEALRTSRYELLAPVCVLPDPTRAGLFAIKQRAQADVLELFADLDVIFPVLHGPFGEDGTLQGLLEMAGVAYVGAGVLGSSLGMDKAVFKDVMRSNGIPVLKSVVVLRRDIEEDIEKTLDRGEEAGVYPLFVKPANLGSSVGINKCRSRADLVEGLIEAARYDRRVLIEQGLEAREIEVSVLGNDNPQASIPGEIIPHGDFYSYEAKYHDDRSQLLIPAPISSEMAKQIQDFAVRAYRAIDCAGMARADFLVEKDTEEIYLNEVNTIPGFTQISMYPKLWEASGLAYPALVDRLIELALERKAERDRTQSTFER